MLLIWDDRNGWQLAVESGPSSALTVVAALSEDLIPAPGRVAAFVAGRATRLVPRARTGDPLAALLERYPD